MPYVYIIIRYGTRGRMQHAASMATGSDEVKGLLLDLAETLRSKAENLPGRKSDDSRGRYMYTH